MAERSKEGGGGHAAHRRNREGCRDRGARPGRGSEAVYEENGQTKMATMLSTAMLAVFPGAKDLKPIAEEVEQKVLKKIDEAK